jgi:AraC-like DNA-binding protein
MRARLMAYLSSNLADSGLSPRTAAAALGMSERMLHALFAGSGTTCRRWIIEQRLIGASAALHEPEWAGSSVSEIAFRLGFSDLSHFSRRFKERFGCSPREFRAQAKSSRAL